MPDDQSIPKGTVRHELGLVRFRTAHDADAQVVLAAQLHQVKLQMTGVVGHKMFYSKAHDCWIEHTQWADDRGADTFVGSEAETAAILRQLSAVTLIEQAS